MDDGSSNQNPNPARHPNGAEFTLDNLFRGGDVVSNVVGVIDDTFGLYRIQPTQGADYSVVNPRPLTPAEVGGDVTVASFNVLNYFNGDGLGGGFPTARGAQNLTEFQRQHNKIVSAIVGLDADIVGLIEIENDTGSNQALETLLEGSVALGVDGINDVSGTSYAFIDAGVIGTDEIKVALIYRPATVSPLGDYAILDSSVNPDFIDTLNRPVLAQTFAAQANDAAFTVAVNHLKSKGSDCNAVGDPDLGDGQGNCNGTRTQAAIAQVEWLASDPTGSGDPDFLIIGDLNSYALEDPIVALEDFGMTNLLKQFEGEFAYSYVFDGQFGYLDHALSAPSTTPQVTGATSWHINADEPDLLDYLTRFKQPAQVAIYAPDAFRASDHDPILVGLGLNAPPVCTNAAPSSEMLWPPQHQMVDVTILGVTDAEGDAVSITIDSIFQDEPVNGLGDGATAPDGAGIGTATASLRAERAGNFNGRVYHVAFTAADATGSCTGVVKVSVPKNLRPQGVAIDGGPLFDSTEADSIQAAGIFLERGMFLPLVGVR